MGSRFYGDPMLRGDGDRGELLASLLGPPHGRCLAVGCARGDVLTALALRGHAPIAVEDDRAARTLAADEARHVVGARTDRLPFRTAVFASAVVIGDQPPISLGELARVLEVAGVLVIGVRAPLTADLLNALAAARLHVAQAIEADKGLVLVTERLSDLALSLEAPASAPGERLQAWWSDEDADDPGRLPLEHPDVQRLLARIAPDEEATDLGGTMALNALLQPSSRVLRVHQQSVTRRRLLAEQALRAHLARGPFVTAEALAVDGGTVLRCGTHLAEVEPYVEAERLPHDAESYRWLFEQLGTLHRALADADMPNAVTATWAPPSSLRRWLARTVPALQGSVAGRAHADRLTRLARATERHWISPARLPQQVVHGDVRLSNLRRTPDGRTLVLDLGFAAMRPRVHDLACALAFMTLARGVPVELDQPIAAYESAHGRALSAAEHEAIPALAAAVMLFHAAHDGYTPDALVRVPERAPFLDVAEHLLATFALV